MRVPRVLFSLVVLSCVALTQPVFAGQRGHGAPPAHPTQPAHPTHPATPAHEAKSAEHHGPVPFAQRIANNPQLAARLQALLPSGMKLADAASGFKNQGQFIAALHVSHNLDIPFDKLKAEMTGADHDSLGKAIHELKPAANAKEAAKTAEKEADEDVKATKPAKPAKPETDNDNDKDKDDKR